MSPRTGRPTTDKKANRESFRFSDSYIEKLNYCVEKTGMSKTDVVRKGIDLVYQSILNEKQKQSNRCELGDLNDYSKKLQKH